MSLKEQFLKKDRVIRGITEDGFFKVAVVKLTDVVRAAQERHQLSLLTTIYLGRTMAGAMLMASDLKGEERVQLKLEGSGPIGFVLAESNRVGEIRGYVRSPDAELDYSGKAKLSDGLGVGVLTFTKVLFNEAKPLRGIVELAGGNVDDDLAYYLTQSEQIPSAVKIDVSLNDQGEVEQAVGVLVQALPGAPDESITLIEQNFASLPSLASLVVDGDYIDDIMHKVLEPLPVKELVRFPVHFFCRCSKERFKSALMTVGIDELKDMQDESQELVCHYCSEKYEITSDEIKELVSKMQ